MQICLCFVKNTDVPKVCVFFFAIVGGERRFYSGGKCSELSASGKEEASTLGWRGDESAGPGEAHLARHLYNKHNVADKSHGNIEACQPATNQTVHYRLCGACTLNETV